MINANYLTDHILYQIFKIILSIVYLKKHGKNTDNYTIAAYVNKTENNIKFKINAGHYLELLTPETMKIFGITKSNITKNENCENVSHLEIIEVVLVHCNIFKDDYQQDSKFLYTFISNKSFGKLLDNSPKIFIFLNNLIPFLYIEVCFANKNSNPLEIEDKN